jgi:hypothetical protein
MRNSVHSIVAALILAPTAVACTSTAQLPDLQISRVVLYQSGIGYIEQRGTVSGESVSIQVRPEQINDVLATLVVLDESGQTASVSLPVDHSSIPMALMPTPAAGGMLQLLQTFRGAEVVVSANGENVRGRIIGTETRNDGAQLVSVFAAGSQIVAIDVSEIDRVDLQNEGLSVGLERSLDRSLSDADWKPVDVTLHFPDSSRRNIQLSYVVEMPAWRPVYRAVVMGDDELLLQGWGIVDNVSGTDWNHVQMSLTAGTPISFRYDLHSPRFIQRPDLSGYGATTTSQLRPPTPVTAMPSAAPPPASPGMARQAAAESMYYDRGQSDGDNSGYGSSAYGPAGDEVMNMRRMAGADMETSTGTTMGSLFRFDLRSRVTVPDQSATMVPLMNQVIPGDDVLLFQPLTGGDAQYAYRALALTNDTDFPVQAAPITIYRQSTFVGEGITPVIEPGEQAFVPYALETSVDISVERTSESGETRLVSIIDGLLTIETASIEETEITVRGQPDSPETLLVQVQRFDSYELLDPPANLQTHPGYYIIPVPITAGAPSTQVVRQTRRLPTQVQVFDPRIRPMLAAWISGPGASDELRQTLSLVNTKLEELAGMSGQADAIRRQRADVQNRTAELRNNIGTLGSSAANAELRATLVERLAEQDLLLQQLAAELVVLSEREAALRIEIVELMQGLELTFED